MTEHDEIRTTRGMSPEGEVEKRSLTTDVAIAIAPSLAVATGKVVDHLLTPNQDDKPKVILPDGVETD